MSIRFILMMALLAFSARVTASENRPFVLHCLLSEVAYDEATDRGIIGEDFYAVYLLLLPDAQLTTEVLDAFKVAQIYNPDQIGGNTAWQFGFFGPEPGVGLITEHSPVREDSFIFILEYEPDGIEGGRADYKALLGRGDKIKEELYHGRCMPWSAGHETQDWFERMVTQKEATP